ncbi:MAG: TIGR02466 family protein, partial [Gammaproteobacteria bacterium]
RPADAEQELLAATGLDPLLTNAWINLGNACRDQGKFEESIAHFEHALTLEPDNALTHTYLGAARLQSGQVKIGLQILDRSRMLNPFDRTTMAYHVVALSENGQLEKARKLLDYDHLLGRHEVSAPAGFDSLGEFNRALAQHVADHPTLQYERSGNTTMKGHQTANLLESAPGPVTALKDIIDRAVRDYFVSLATDTSHPYLAWKPERWRYAMWGVILNKQGHQDPHIHPDAWISGVYYVQLPAEIKTGDDDTQGWLEFGQPPASLNCRAEQPTRLMRPEEGTLFMFPSFFYHRTIPFDSEEPRISIAFDLRPLV